MVKDGVKMKQDKIYNEIVSIVKEQKIMEKKRKGQIQNSNGDILPGIIFSTSEETDIREMISDGLSNNEIISKIKKW